MPRRGQNGEHQVVGFGRGGLESGRLERRVHGGKERRIQETGARRAGPGLRAGDVVLIAGYLRRHRVHRPGAVPSERVRDERAGLVAVERQQRVDVRLRRPYEGGQCRVGEQVRQIGPLDGVRDRRRRDRAAASEQGEHLGRPQRAHVGRGPWRLVAVIEDGVLDLSAVDPSHRVDLVEPRGGPGRGRQADRGDRPGERVGRADMDGGPCDACRAARSGRAVRHGRAASSGRQRRHGYPGRDGPPPRPRTEAPPAGHRVTPCAARASASLSQ